MTQNLPLKKAFLVNAVLTALALAGCVAKPLTPEQSQKVDVVSAVSLLGNDFHIDALSRPLLRHSEKSLDVSAWKIDDTFRDLLREGSVSRGKEFRVLNLDPVAVEKIQKSRENRWKKVLGKQNQALMELLFRQAEAQGVPYFFLLTNLENPERFPLHQGPAGVFCNDQDPKNARASVYFSFDFSLWDVAKKKKVFEQVVDPSVTEVMTFGDCKIIAALADPETQLEDPVKKTMGLLVDALLDKMGWKKPGQP